MIFEFEIEGRPVGKGRPRFARRGNFVSTYTPTATRDYEKKVQTRFIQKYGNIEPLETSVALKIKAYFGVPKGTSKRKTFELMGTHYPKKPDVDNISKIILDALNGLAFIDDNRVVYLEVQKFYNEDEKVVVSVEEME
jgi:Holliday junction resolvase RusA-like endonuclease